MITNEAVIEAKECLVEYWGEDGKKVIAEGAFQPFAFVRGSERHLEYLNPL